MSRGPGQNLQNPEDPEDLPRPVLERSFNLMKFPNPHEYADRIGLALDLAVARKIRDNPSLVDVAKQNLARWRTQNGGTLAPPHQEWERVLRFLSASQIANFIV